MSPDESIWPTTAVRHENQIGESCRAAIDVLESTEPQCGHDRARPERRRSIRRFQAEGIEFAYPTQSLYLRKVS